MSYVINPYTHRPIKVGGRNYKNLVKKGVITPPDNIPEELEEKKTLHQFKKTQPPAYSKRKYHVIQEMDDLPVDDNKHDFSNSSDYATSTETPKSEPKSSKEELSFVAQCSKRVLEENQNKFDSMEESDIMEELKKLIYAELMAEED